MSKSQIQLKKPANLEEKTTALQILWSIYKDSEPSDAEIDAFVDAMREDPTILTSFNVGSAATPV